MSQNLTKFDVTGALLFSALNKITMLSLCSQKRWPLLGQ